MTLLSRIFAQLDSPRQQQLRSRARFFPTWLVAGNFQIKPNMTNGRPAACLLHCALRVQKYEFFFTTYIFEESVLERGGRTG